jgi:hypothetical protein
MLQSIKTVLCIMLITIIAGCAGRNFVRPTDDTFKLGQTSYSQVVGSQGEPRRVGTLLKNDKNIKTITYAYAATGGEPSEDGVIPARAMAYYFENDILVGKEFVSSFKSDSSNFDDTRISAIVKGKTTRENVNQLLGRPSGSYIYPMVKATNGEALGYSYVTTRGGAFGGFKVFRKSLRVSFDQNNLVSDVEFSSSGN